MGIAYICDQPLRPRPSVIGAETTRLLPCADRPYAGEIRGPSLKSPDRLSPQSQSLDYTSEAGSRAEELLKVSPPSGAFFGDYSIYSAYFSDEMKL